uniref:ZF-HD dimerization-type domain-containing protein n=1 Tax=Davidia involucrata TaxID=16924 RepID=A0A5B7BUF2_DAVIN
MEVRGQEKEMTTPNSSGYNPIFRESPETLDHHLQGRIEPKSSGSSFKASTRYRECLKNHAASIGGNIVDGCGEFMPSGEEGTLEALKCAACNCHRNFHRKEAGGDADFTTSTMLHPLQLPPPHVLPSPSFKQHQINSMGMMHTTNHHWASIVPPVKMAFAGGGSAATDSSSEDLNFNAFQSNAVPPPPPPPFVLSKKRFRSKFTQEQKEKMLEFAEKVGWRIPKEDDVDVQRFCAEVGVKRQVFKVWMHNNKSSGKKQQQQES